jgi:protocatechuate 3,4-dioxygenase beta subunit
MAVEKILTAVGLGSILLMAAGTARSQDVKDARLVGGPCEGCEAVFEYGGRVLSPVDTLPDFGDPGPRLKITGTIYQRDGKTPASGVILYVYHTDQSGVYATRGDETGWGRRHGYIRGWVRTDSSGKYAFYTLKPGTYPSRSAAAHIHPIILEPDGRYYWLESYLFEGDSLLTERELSPRGHRGGGSVVLSLEKEGDLLVGERDIVLLRCAGDAGCTPAQLITP